MALRDRTALGAGPRRSRGARRLLPLVLGLVLGCTLVAALVPVAGCGGSTELPKTSMKGFELYSWQDDGRWFFSLLEGTNRIKTVDEIHASDARLKGIDALKVALRGIEAGQWVTWWTPSWAEGTVIFPPEDMVQQVRQVCEKQGLQLQVVTQGP